MFPDFVLASQNPHKIQEFAQLFPSCKVSAAAPYDAEETEPDYQGNALIKARAAQKAELAAGRSSYVLADDSGLEVLALGSRPGVWSARYGLSPECPEISSSEQNLLLLKELAPHKDRRARFVCCLVLLSPSGEVITAQASLEGLLAKQPRSRQLHAKQPKPFGYDPIFLLPELGKTLAELEPEQKQQLSHRFLACQKLQELVRSSLPVK